MLGMYEKRSFDSGEKVWLGYYRNLTNVLHWHFECELIRVVQGHAQIKIGDACFDAAEGDCFFCAGEELHYIISEPDAQVAVMILDEHIAKDITDRYALVSPKLPDAGLVRTVFARIRALLSRKQLFYREALENSVRGLVIEIFRSCAIAPREERPRFYRNLISKINDEFAFITFEDAVRYSGYSAAYFSKLFKRLSGMNFSEYLNIIKVENAISLMRSNRSLTMTVISAKCGFSTVRNFNRVFRQITGVSPSNLPADFMINTGIQTARTGRFDPTNEHSVLI